jgi:hypothetical protein
MNPRAFLEREGFDLKTAHHELLDGFALSLGERAGDAYEINAALAAGIGDAAELYRLPETVEQSSLLFSIDRSRYIRNFQFLKRALLKLRPSSIIEFGSGDGLTLSFARQILPDSKVLGVEREANLAAIANNERGISTLVGDFRDISNEPGDRFELGICNFGWENSDLPRSSRPHVIRNLGKHEICQACAEDLRDALIPIVGAWRDWLTERAPLIVAGRIRNPTEGWAFVAAAREFGWSLSIPESDMLAVPSEQGFHEKFPHLVFRPAAPSANSPDSVDKLRW